MTDGDDAITIAEAWFEAVDAAVAECERPPPAPLNAVADWVRENGDLPETPALALIDEIQALNATARRGAAAGDGETRDVFDPCPAFESGEPYRYGDCETDGHYGCDGCVNRASCEGGCGRRPAQCECEICEGCGLRQFQCECGATADAESAEPSAGNPNGNPPPGGEQ